VQKCSTGVKFEYVPILLGGIFKATNNRSRLTSLRYPSELSNDRHERRQI
jgi:hypothetical protein